MIPITAKGLVDVVRAKDGPGRQIIGIAGAPGAGKSTLAEELCDRLNDASPGSAAVLPMDGYHFDDAILEARGWRARKGAPHTFDVNGFAAMLERLRTNAEDEIAVPVFFREEEVAHNAARMISKNVRYLIVEGNYLLLDQPPWSELRFDTSVFLEVPVDELRRRLEDRWRGLTGEELRAKLEDNDLPNVELVAGSSRRADYVVRNH